MTIDSAEIYTVRRALETHAILVSSSTQIEAGSGRAVAVSLPSVFTTLNRQVNEICGGTDSVDAHQGGLQSR